MKVIGSGKNMSAIRFHYKGTDLNFRHILPKAYMEEIEAEITEIPLIEFDDASEIELMIAMLHAFQSECKGSLGVWRRENEHE